MLRKTHDSVPLCDVKMDVYGKLFAGSCGHFSLCPINKIYEKIFINVSAQYLPEVHGFPQYTKLGKKIILL